MHTREMQKVIRKLKLEGHLDGIYEIFHLKERLSCLIVNLLSTRTPRSSLGDPLPFLLPSWIKAPSCNEDSPPLAVTFQRQ